MPYILSPSQNSLDEKVRGEEPFIFSPPMSFEKEDTRNQANTFQIYP
jgi:hypothetical protein